MPRLPTEGGQELERVGLDDGAVVHVGRGQLGRDVARIEVRQRHQLVGVGRARRRRAPAHRLRVQGGLSAVRSAMRGSWR